MTYQDALIAFERDFLEQALIASDLQILKASKAVDLPLSTFKWKMRRAGLSGPNTSVRDVEGIELHRANPRASFAVHGDADAHLTAPVVHERCITHRRVGVGVLAPQPPPRGQPPTSEHGHRRQHRV